MNKKETEMQLENQENIKLAIYVNDEKTKTIPTKGENIFDETKSNCTNDASITWDYESWSPIVKNMTSFPTKCSLFFQKITEEIGKTYTYDFTNEVQEFVVDLPGFYQIEIWGASGGDIEGNFEYLNGGNGGYAKGTIFLQKNTILYIYIGEEGKINGDRTFNGGGASAAKDNVCASGGGATDIRLVKGKWDDFNSLKSRIMIAGGGAGSERIYPSGVGGGIASTSSYSEKDIANQTYGYSFGIGQDAVFGSNASGAGGGYYGGGTSSMGTVIQNFYYSSAGGSGFVSGHNGCNAITIESDENKIIHSNQNIHFSNYKFTDTDLKSGNESIPSHDGSQIIVGNNGNGYAKIKYLGTAK